MDTRKGFGDKLSEKATPQSSKSTLDKVKEGVTGAGDKIQRDAVPDSQKSTSQKLQDRASREKSHQNHGDGMVNKTKDMLGMNKH